jgi:hypothetical protein
MTPESNPPHSIDRLVGICQSLPAVEVDCSDWPRGPGSYTDCDLERVCEPLPPVEMEFVPRPDVFLDLTFTLAPGADAGRVFANAVKLFERVDEYDKSLGGSGVRWEPDRSRPQNGTLHVMLAPKESAGAEQRLHQLASLIVGAVAAFQAVNAVSARGRRSTEPDRPLFEIREVAA